MANRVTVFSKDPDSILDYSVVWSQWLPGTDVIVHSMWILPADLVEESSSHTDTETVVWLSGAIVGQRDTVTNRITTAAGRVEDYSFVILGKEN